MTELLQPIADTVERQQAGRSQTERGQGVEVRRPAQEPPVQARRHGATLVAGAQSSDRLAGKHLLADVHHRLDWL